MLILRSALYNLYLYTMTVILALIWLPVVLAGSRSGTLKGMRTWSKTSLWGLKVIAGTGLELRGLENLPKEGAYIVAAKHQSMWDVVALFGLVPEPAFIAKDQLLKVPLVGLFAKNAGTIGINRGAAAKALRQMVADAGEAMAEGRNLLIFPEGTRRAPGDEPAYKPGIAALYTRLDQPVVPVALNSGVYWPRRKFLRKPGTIVLEYLPVIEPGLDRGTFMKTLQERIETASNRLLEE